MQMTPAYRPDIDGLRAIAVLSIVFFHLGFDLFPGGFVGVDIFFVISGYLITSIILRELNQGDFSLIRFYERRMRRIFPALFMVLLATLLTGLALSEPGLVMDLGKSVMAASVFSSNILFYFEIDYFRRLGELRPLLHTWSLGVEEQFYILFPLIVIGISRFAKARYLPIFLVLLVLSLAANIAIVEDNRSIAFYMIQFRAWELLAGSVLALGIIPGPRSVFWRNLMGFAGILLMAYAVFFFDKRMDFPGALAMVPVFGSALIICAGKSGDHVLGRILGFKPLVFIGLVSYSFYLWHWPAIIFAGYYNIVSLSLVQKFALLFTIFGISVLSWKFIETPFRKKTILATTPSMYGFSAISSLLLIALGFTVVSANGFPGRYNYDQSPFYISDDRDWEYSGSCEWIYKRLEQGNDLCDFGAESVSPSFLLWGDSFARSYFTSLNESAKRHNVGGKIATQRACTPLLGIERRGRQICGRFNDTVIQYLQDHPEITTVFLAANWKWMLGVKMYDYYDKTPKASRLEYFQTGLNRTVERIRELGRKVYLVRSVPDINSDVPSAQYVSYATGRDVNSIIGPDYAEFLADNAQTDSVITELENRGLATVINPAEYLCDSGRCKVVADSGLLYRDSNHLSTPGSALVSPSFDVAFETR